MKIELRDHPARIRDQITGELVPALPEMRGIFCVEPRQLLLGYTAAAKNSPISFIVDSRTLTPQTRERVIRQIREIRGDDDSAPANAHQAPVPQPTETEIDIADQLLVDIVGEDPDDLADPLHAAEAATDAPAADTDTDDPDQD